MQDLFTGEFVWMELYRDSIPGWPDIEDLDDNLCAIPFPVKIVDAWYREVIWPRWYQKSLTLDDVKTWIRDHYTTDETDGLFQFAADRGYYPEDIELYSNW